MIVIILIPVKSLAYEGGYIFTNVGNHLGNKTALRAL